MPTDTAPTELVSQFATTSRARVQHDVLIELVRRKQLHEVSSHDFFRHGLNNVAQTAAFADSDHQRLLAVATLGRVSAVVKSLRRTVSELLKESITRPLPDLHQLSDVDDRLYVAQSWRSVRADWYHDYLARAAVREDSGENVRRECIAGLLHLVANLSSAIGRLTLHFLEVRFDTKKPGNSRARRLKRVLHSLHAVLTTSDTPLGSHPGRQLGDLLMNAFPRSGLPEADDVRAEVADQVAIMIHQIVRSGFSNGVDATTYDALAVVSEWFHTTDWRDLCESSTSIVRVRKDIEESLVLLAKQPAPDDRVRQALVTSCGSATTALTICRRIATRVPGIPPDIRNWLVNARRRTRSTFATESRERSIDEVLAELFIDITQLSVAASVVQTNLLPEVRTILPQSATALARLTGVADTVANKMALATKWRSLRQRGKVGDVVYFSPLEHRVISGDTRTAQVRIVRPAVERITEDGVPDIIVKAFVEPVTTVV